MKPHIRYRNNGFLLEVAGDRLVADLRAARQLGRQ
jgi:hypothetical protein